MSIHRYHSMFNAQPCADRDDSSNLMHSQTALSTGVLTTLLQTLASAPAEVPRVLLCASIIFNLGATTCAVVCLFILSDFTTKARILAATKEGSLPRKLLLNDMIHLEYLQEEREREILRKFGMRLPWSIASTLMVTCFLLGTICTFTGFGVWVWYQGPQSVVVIVTSILGVVGGISILVLLLLLIGM